MSELQFAIAIIFPGAGIGDVVKAALRKEVHVIDKENYDSRKDYAAYSATYEPYISGSRILLLFVFPNAEAILAENEQQLAKAIEKSKAYNNW